MAKFNPDQQEVQPPHFYKDVAQGSRPGGGLVQEAPVVDTTVDRRQEWKPIDYPAPAKVDYSFMDVNLFSDVLDKTIKGADWAIQSHLKHEVQAGYDAVNEEVGVAATSEGIGAIPNELRSQQRILEGMTAAKNAGTMSEVHYWGRLDSMTRQMKNRWPGYREEIDQMISSLAGSKPANALRRAMLAQLEAGSSKMDQLEKTVAGANGLPVDYFDRKNGQSDLPPYTYDELLQYHSYQNKKRADLDYDDKYISHMAKRGEIDQKGLESRFQERAAKLVYELTMPESTSGIAGDLDNLRTRLATLDAQRDKNQPHTPEQQTEIRATFSRIRSTYQQAIMALASQPLDEDRNSFISLGLGKDKLDELTDTALLHIGYLEERWLNKDYGHLAHNANIAEAIRDHDVAHVLRNDRAARGVQAASKIFGETFTDGFLSRNSSELGAIEQSVIDTIKMEGIAGSGGEEFNNSSLADGIKQLSEVTDNPKAFAGLVTDVAKVLEESEVEEGDEHVIEYLFGTGNHGVMETIGDRDSQLVLYKTLTSPKIRKKMEGLKETRPDLWEKYSTWTQVNFNQLFGKEMMDVGSSRVWRQRVNIGWNPNKFEWTINPTPQAQKEKVAPLARPIAPLSEVVDQLLTPAAERAVHRLNDALKSVVPVLQADGKEPNAWLLESFMAHGLDPDAPKQENFLGELFRAMDEAVLRGFKNIDEYVQLRGAAAQGPEAVEASHDTLPFQIDWDR